MQLSGPQAGNYDLESTAISGKIGIITPATLAYVANPVIDLLGTSFPILTGTVSGFVGPDTLDSSTTGTLTFSTTATPPARLAPTRSTAPDLPRQTTFSCRRHPTPPPWFWRIQPTLARNRYPWVLPHCR